MKKIAILVFLTIVSGMLTGVLPVGAETGDGGAPASDQTRQAGDAALGSKGFDNFTTSLLALTDKVKEKAQLTLAKGKAETKESEGKSEQDTSVLPKGDAKMNQLLRLWGVFGSDVQDSCTGFGVGDLRCFTDSTDWDRLQEYDRPVLIRIKHGGKLQTVLLTTINKEEKTATLVGGDDARNVDIDLVKQHWTGEYVMIWRCDSGSQLIFPGARSDSVIWLRQRLQLARESRLKDSKDADDSKNSGNHLSMIFDPGLTRELRAFQRRHELRADGIAGPRTQIMLNNVAPIPGTPDLKPGKKSASPSSSDDEKSTD